MKSSSAWNSLYFPLGSHFLTEKNVDYIEDRLKSFPLEFITIGDAGEINNCQVGRLMEDHPGCEPCILNEELSLPILDLYKTKEAQSFFAKFLKNPRPQFVRRSQFNLLGQGSFVGRHLDIDSNPDYQIAAVLQLGSSFDGGEFVVYENETSTENQAQVISPDFGSLTISFCRHEHEVKEVLKGLRTSFVCFISNDNNANRRTSLD